MKKYTVKNLLICLYICIVVYLCYGYFYDSPLKAMGFYEIINNYFGRSIFIIVVILIIDLFGMFIKCKKKRGIYNVRFVFLIILILASISIYFAKEIGIPFEKVLAKPEQLRKLTEIGLYKYKIGLFFVFLLDWLFDKVMGLYIYIVGYILLGISMFFLFAKAVRVSIMWVIKTIRKKQRERKERKLYEEQKKLEEYYRRIEEEKEIARQKQLELEAQIEKERAIMESMSDENLDDELEDEDSRDSSEEIEEGTEDSDKPEELEKIQAEVNDSIETEERELAEDENSTDEVSSKGEETEENLDREAKEGDFDERSQTESDEIDDISSEETEESCEKEDESVDSDVHIESEYSENIGSENEDVDENDSEDENIDNKDSEIESESNLEEDSKNRELKEEEKDSSETQESGASIDEDVVSVEDELEKIKKLVKEKEEKADDTSL